MARERKPPPLEINTHRVAACNLRNQLKHDLLLCTQKHRKTFNDLIVNPHKETSSHLEKWLSCAFNINNRIHVSFYI